MLARMLAKSVAVLLLAFSSHAAPDQDLCVQEDQAVALLQGRAKGLWTHTAAEALAATEAPRPGVLNRVVWMAWTGDNAIPSHLNLTIETVRRNSGLPVVLVTPKNLAQYVSDVHPAYQYLNYAHRADFLRTYLLHNYGGIWLDTDTICLKSLEGLFDELDKYDAVGYDGSQWFEIIGISGMGPFKPQTELTSQWFSTLEAKLDQGLDEMKATGKDAFRWNEILHDIFVPICKAQEAKISKAMQATNPSWEMLQSTEPMGEVLKGLDSFHIIILNNAIYGDKLAEHSKEELLQGGTVLSQLFRKALGQ